MSITATVNGKVGLERLHVILAALLRDYYVKIDQTRWLAETGAITPLVPVLEKRLKVPGLIDDGLEIQIPTSKRLFEQTRWDIWSNVPAAVLSSNLPASPSKECATFVWP